MEERHTVHGLVEKIVSHGVRQAWGVFASMVAKPSWRQSHEEDFPMESVSQVPPRPVRLTKVSFTVLPSVCLGL